MDIVSTSAWLRRQKLWVFAPKDTSLLFPKQNRRLTVLQLHQWAKKGWITRLKRGLYELAFPEPAPLPDFYIANKLYEPSYISLETALSHYQLIPEMAAQVTCVTPKPTRRFVNVHGLFTYFSVTPQAFQGACLIHLQGVSILMAEPEKALMDWLYAKIRKGENPLKAQERWNSSKLKNLNRKKINHYASFFKTGSQKMKEAADALLR